jgi:hypothetical protein
VIGQLEAHELGSAQVKKRKERPIDEEDASEYTSGLRRIFIRKAAGETWRFGQE